MKIKRITVGLYQTNCYIVEDKDYLLVIDPGDNLQKITDNLKQSPTHVVFTHNHFDHVGAAMELHEKFPQAKFFWGEYETKDPKEICDIACKAMGPYFLKSRFVNGFELPQEDGLLSDGQAFLNFKVIYTPGHTHGSICLYCEDEGVLFSGDTVFCHSYGRTDLGGDEKEIFESIKKIMALKETCVIYPGHGFSTTVAEEKINYCFN